MSQPESPKRAAPRQDATSQAARAAKRLLRSAQQWLEGVRVCVCAHRGCFPSCAPIHKANTPTSNAAPKPPPEGATAAPAQQARADQEQDKSPPRKELPTPPCALIACGNNERMQADYVNKDLCKNTQYVPRICQCTKLPFWWGTNGPSHSKYHLVYRRCSPTGAYEYGLPSVEADVECSRWGSPALYFEFAREMRSVHERCGSDVELVLQKQDLLGARQPAPWQDEYVFPSPDIQALAAGDAGYATAPEELRGAIWLFVDHCGHT